MLDAVDCFALSSDDGSKIWRDAYTSKYDGYNTLLEGVVAGKNTHARELAKLGAAKGGVARAARIDPETRSEIARAAAEARWGTEGVRRATHDGKIVLGGITIECVVLESNGREPSQRVLTQGTFLRAIGRQRSPKAGTSIGRVLDRSSLPPFLSTANLQDYITDEIRQRATPIEFRTKSGGRAFGYDANLLADVCDVYLDAAEDDERQKIKLTEAQRKTAAACRLLIRGFARLGIIALVDEATGYQEQRAKDELHRILEAYIAPELMPWTRMFPDEFFRDIYRLHGWAYKPGTAKRTPQVGHLINRYIYEQLPPQVLPELRRRNPVTARGYRKHKHFQFLTADTGNPHLDRQITTVMTLMRISNTKQEFEDLFARAFRKVTQERLPLIIDVESVDQPTERKARRKKMAAQDDPNAIPLPL